MGRQKGGIKKPEKEGHDDGHRAVIEAIKAKRQECLEALEKSNLQETVKFSQELSRISCPLRPSLPLAQAAKLAAQCAITTHLRHDQGEVVEPKVMSTVLVLLKKATQWAWEGFNSHKSGLCTKLWVALAFLVEDNAYRQTFSSYVLPHALRMVDTKDDEIEEAPKQPQNKSQSGGDSMALGTGRGMKQALGAAKNRIDKSHPLESGVQLIVQYYTCVHRLFVFHVIDFLYTPVSDEQMTEQKHRAMIKWNLMGGPSRAAQVCRSSGPARETMLLKAQMQKEPGKFRMLRMGGDRLLVPDVPEEEEEEELQESSAQSEALPARSGIRSHFFLRQEVDVASIKGRLPAAKEREAHEKAKLVLEHFDTLAEPPIPNEKLVELLEVPLPLLQAHLEKVQKEAHDKAGELPERFLAVFEVQVAVLKDCLASGMPYARLTCEGQASRPSFASELADALAQLDGKEKASEEEGACPTDDTEHSLYARVSEGIDILWEGELPSSLSVLTPQELHHALQKQSCREAEGATASGVLHPMNALFSASTFKSGEEDARIMELLARSPEFAGSTHWLESLLQGQEALKYGSLGVGAALPLYDAFSMEWLGQIQAGENFRGGHVLKMVSRPTLADLRTVTMGTGQMAQARKQPPERETCHPKFEPLLDLDEQGGSADEQTTRVAQLCRGRLVLAMQCWLWRLEAWLHAPSWTSKLDPPLRLQMHDEALRGLCMNLHLDDEDLLRTSNYLVVGTGPQSKDPSDGSFLGSLIDEPHFSRYRFTPAEDSPGSASGRHGLTYTPTPLEASILLGSSSSTDATADKQKQDADASAAAGVAADETHRHENGKDHGADDLLNRKWLGSGPSPLDFAEPHAYYTRNTDMKEEVIEEILDILEILRLSKLLSVDIVRGVAMLIAEGFKMETSHCLGANLLQVTWEHMTVLSAEYLTTLRERLLNCLGQHWRWTYPLLQVEDPTRHPMGCFQMKPDKSGFQLVSVPAKPEVVEEATTKGPPCSCCHPGAEHAHEELPGTPANPPKQHRSRGKPESQPQENGTHASGKATAGSGMAAASSVPDLAQELHDAHATPGKLPKFIVEALYGAGNKASAMLPTVMHVAMPEGCTEYRKWMLSAAFCARLVKDELDNKDKLSKSLRKAVANMPFLLETHEKVVVLAKSLMNAPSEMTAKDLRPLAAVLEDVQRSTAGIWAGAIKEVQQQAAILEAQTLALAKIARIDRVLLHGTIYLTRDSEDSTLRIHENLKVWMTHSRDIQHRLGAFESRAAPKQDRTPSPERLLRITQQRGGGPELQSILRGSVQNLRDAMAAGVLALTCVDHRLAALRTAVIAIERRLEEELKLYCGDVLQTSLVEILTEKLHKEAKSEMEEKRRKAEELLLSGEAASEKNRQEAAAKRAAKKERQLRQKAEVQRAAEEKAAAEAAAAERAGAAPEPASHGQHAEADAAADEANPEGLELAGMEGSNGTMPQSSLQSHSLGGDAYSEDEFEEAYHAEEQEHSSRVISAPRSAEGPEQPEASAAQKKKRNKAIRKRAAAVRAGSEEQQQHHSSAAFPTGWPSEAQDDGSEWQEAKPKRSHQRKDQQQHEEGPCTPQKPGQGVNGQAERSSGHVRDPILASLHRHKPSTTSRECAQCGNNAHRVMECPQLQSMSRSDRSDCAVALMDGDHARVERIRAEPRKSCHVCDAMHDLRVCLWLHGMPDAMREDLLSAYKRLKIHEKDRILQHWVEIRRDIQRKLPPPPPLPGTPGAPSYISPSKALQSLQPGASGKLHGHALAAQQQPGVRRQEQPQWGAPYGAQEAEHSETAYLSADEGAAFELTPFPSPARPQPRSKARSAAEGAPFADARSDQYAASGEQWEGESSGAEETSFPMVNYVGGMEPAVGVPVDPSIARPDQDFNSLMTMLRPPDPGPTKGWSKVVAGEPVDLSVGPTPGEAQRRAAAAAQAKQEEDDMQAAIQASLTQTRPAPAQLTRLAQQMGPPQQQQPQTLTGPGAGMPGLQNQIGEYNCFLNVVVQCLWHCRDFKRQFSSLAQENPAIVQSNDVVAGLADLFSKFDAQERLSGEQQESAQRQIVAPTKLRDALHALDPHRFSTGEMSDAAEVLGAIYEQLAELPEIGALATQVFELPVREAVHCQNCGKDTHQSSFGQSFYCVSATALRMQAMLAQADNEGLMPPLGELLLGIDAQDQKTCDTDEGGCGRLNHIQRFLEGVPPPVFTLQLAWESHAESTEAITEVLDAVQEEVDIGEIYKALGSKEYRLHSMVCYYGEHYHAFVHTEGRWVAFDDATLNQVGGWEDVVKKCILGKIQPSLLFYEEVLGG